MDAEGLKAAEIAVQLQDWFEDTDGLSSVPVAGITWTRDTLSLFVGELCLWDDQSRECELTLANMKIEFQKHVANLNLIASK